MPGLCGDLLGELVNLELAMKTDSLSELLELSGLIHLPPGNALPGRQPHPAEGFNSWSRNFRCSFGNDHWGASLSTVLNGSRVVREEPLGTFCVSASLKGTFISSIPE